MSERARHTEEARAEREQRRWRSVECPTCGQAPGRACIDARSLMQSRDVRTIKSVHPSRKRAAG